MTTALQPCTLLAQVESDHATPVGAAAERVGLEPLFAASSDQALWHAAHSDPAVIVLSAALAACPVIELLDRIRERAGSPIIILASAEGVASADLGREHWGVTYLSMPVALEAIVPVLQATLAWERERRHLRGRLDGLIRAVAREGEVRNRQILAAELQGSVGRELTEAMALLASMDAQVAHSEPVSRASIAVLRDLISHAESYCRALNERNQRHLGAGDSLSRALAELVEMEGAVGQNTCRYDGPGSVPAGISDSAGYQLVQMVRDTVRGIRRYRSGAQLRVRLQVNAEAAELSVWDNGEGRHHSVPEGLYALDRLSIKYRAAAIGATLVFHDSARPGALWVVTLPLVARRSALAQKGM
jgi:signal transduction histidine kinase